MSRHVRPRGFHRKAKREFSSFAFAKVLLGHRHAQTGTQARVFYVAQTLRSRPCGQFGPEQRETGEPQEGTLGLRSLSPTQDEQKEKS